MDKFATTVSPVNTLLFATNNEHKVAEVEALLEGKFKILSLREAGIDQDIPEPFDSLEENAAQKAKVIYGLLGQNCFAEDTGLEVPALHGEPGVKSARYAGDDRSFEKNIDKLLSKLAGSGNREAQFRTVICLLCHGKEQFFEGVCKGTILAERKGNSGFGYDPVFIPFGSTKTFAEMSMAEKNDFSHRRKAVDKLIAYLKQNPCF